MPNAPDAPKTLGEKWKSYRNRPQERIGFWFGLLLLFAPVFYLLLWWKPYSVTARTGWGIWLGLIVFVKLTGLAEDPIVAITNTMSPAELGVQRQKNQASGKRFKPKSPPSLDAYLAKLEGGALGTLLKNYQINGRGIALTFYANDGFLKSRQDIANISIGVLYGMFYGRDFEHVCLDYTFKNTPLHFAVTRQNFNTFFKVTEAQMRTFGQSQPSFNASPLRTLKTPQLKGFIEEFASTHKGDSCR